MKRGGVGGCTIVCVCVCAHTCPESLCTSGFVCLCVQVRGVSVGLRVCVCVCVCVCLRVQESWVFMWTSSLVCLCFVFPYVPMCGCVSESMHACLLAFLCLDMFLYVFRDPCVVF